MNPYLQDADFTLWNGDSLAVLRTLPDESVDCCITSPPYWGLRDYGTGQWEGGDEGCDHAVRADPCIESSTLGGGKATTGHQREGFGAVCGRCGARRIDNQLRPRTHSRGIRHPHGRSVPRGTPRAGSAWGRRNYMARRPGGGEGDGGGGEVSQKPDHGMHYIWDYERNTGICWCGEDHKDESGYGGPIPEDQWIPADDPRVEALLDDMYLEAWLGHDHKA